MGYSVLYLIGWFSKLIKSSENTYLDTYTPMLLALSTLFPQPWYQGPTKITELSQDELFNKVKGSKDKKPASKYWVVMLYANWSLACLNFEAVLAKLSLKYSADHIKFGKSQSRQLTKATLLTYIHLTRQIGYWCIWWCRRRIWYQPWSGILWPPSITSLSRRSSHSTSTRVDRTQRIIFCSKNSQRYNYTHWMEQKSGKWQGWGTTMVSEKLTVYECILGNGGSSISFG